MTCQFCGSPSTLLCDGVVAPGETCDKPMCRACAKKISSYHLNMGRNGCRWDTFDLCPECVTAGRSVHESNPPIAPGPQLVRTVPPKRPDGQRWHKLTKNGHAGAYFYRVDNLSQETLRLVRRSLVGSYQHTVTVLGEGELPKLRHFEDVEGVEVFYQGAL